MMKNLMVTDSSNTIRNLYSLPANVKFNSLDLTGADLGNWVMPDGFECEKLILVDVVNMTGAYDFSGVKTVYADFDSVKNVFMKKKKNVCYVDSISNRKVI